MYCVGPDCTQHPTLTVVEPETHADRGLQASLYRSGLPRTTLPIELLSRGSKVRVLPGVFRVRKIQSFSDVENFLQSVMGWRILTTLNTTLHLEVLWDETLPVVY